MRSTEETLTAKNSKVPLDEYLVFMRKNHDLHTFLDMVAKAIMHTGDAADMLIAFKVQDAWHDVRAEQATEQAQYERRCF